jgi:hypothetical protein
MTLEMSYKYAIAISFLSQDEGLARTLKGQLELHASLPVFVYSDWQQELTGKSLEEAFEPIFERLSRIVVVLHRQGWGKAGGTLVEHRAISRRRVRSDERFLYVIAVEKNVLHPPWAEDLVYHDLTAYPLEEAIAAIRKMLESHEHEFHSISPAESSDVEHRNSLREAALSKHLVADFTTIDDIYRGYFGGPASAADSKRWQPKDGEAVDSSVLPKLPYYHTYWGYEAALRLTPGRARQWSSITLAAIARHFGAGRWLRVVRKYSFSEGPRTSPYFAESVRHTARAAEITLLLAPDHRRVSEVAWELLREAKQLQRDDGGWAEFRDPRQPSSLWSTVYVYRFLSKLVQSDQKVPDERERFVEQASGLISESERFIAKHWQENRWALNTGVSWDEGAAAILGEVGPFFSDDVLIQDVYHALRAMLTPAGRLIQPEAIPIELHEDVYTLRLVFGLKSAGRQLADNDSRYQRAVEWLADDIDISGLTAYDVAFAVYVFGLGSTTDGVKTEPTS